MRRLINQKPDRSGALLLGALPFLLICILYLFASHSRLTENPNDKVLPALSTFAATIHTVAFEADKRTGDILLWCDSAASLTRLGIGVAVSALAGLLFGIATGALPFVRASLAPFIAALSLIPPLALLPVLFIVFGLGELSKVVLIVFGIAPFIMRDVSMRVGELPSEQIIKAQTLGASSWQVITRVILPQILPRLLDAVRLSLGAAWLFLIAAEAIAAEDGLGYRIFLVRRYLAMDLILPYVVWITLLAFLTDYTIRRFTAWAYPWYQGGARRS